MISLDSVYVLGMQRRRIRSSGKLLVTKSQIYFTKAEKSYVEEACARLGVGVSTRGAELLLKDAHRVLRKPLPANI